MTERLPHVRSKFGLFPGALHTEQKAEQGLSALALGLRSPGPGARCPPPGARELLRNDSHALSPL